MTGKERVTESGKGTSVLTLILSYPQNRDAKDWAAGNGRLSYLILLLVLCLRVWVEHSLLLELAKYAIFSKTKPQNKILTNEEGIASTKYYSAAPPAGVVSISMFLMNLREMTSLPFRSISLGILNRKQFINKNNLKSMLCTKY